MPGPQELLDNLTSPYPKEMSNATTLPSGFGFSVSPTSGTLQTGDLVITVSAWDGLVFTVKPSTLTVEWKSKGVTRTASIDGLTSWTITGSSAQHVIVTLPGGITISAYASGIVRFTGLGTKLTFIQTTPNVNTTDDGKKLTMELNADSWWLSGDDHWKIVSKQLTASPTMSVFHAPTDATEWPSDLLLLSASDLYIGKSNLEKLARAIHMASWGPLEAEVDELEVQMHLDTMSLENLTKFGVNALALPPRRDEPAALYAARIRGEIAARSSGPRYDDVIRAVASMTYSPLSGVTITEHKGADGEYEPYLIDVKYDVNPIIDEGVPESLLTQLADDVIAVVDRITAAGVHTTVTTTGGGDWDVTAYDSTGDPWNT